MNPSELWDRPRLSLRRPLPLGSRVGLLIAALAAFLVACGRPAAPLAPVAPPGPQRTLQVDGVEPASGISPAGRERIVVRGVGFEPGMVVWVGDSLVREVTVEPGGQALCFTSPRARAGVSLDLGVGRTDDGERPVLRVVATGGYRTGGLSATGVSALAVALALLALLGAPLFVVIASVACLGYYLQAQVDPNFGFLWSGADPNSPFGVAAGKGNAMFTSWLVPMGESPLFIAIPLFTFAGTLLSESQTPTRLINLCRALLGWLPGGLALVTLVACCFFTAFTGASGVTIVALGGLLFPILLRERYPERFSLGLLTTGGSLGLLFPPSLPVIVYGLVARVDVGRLFQAALIPGILLVIFLAVTSFIVAIQSQVPRHAFTTDELKTSLRGALWELPLPFLVIGGIYSGFITAAEASAVTAAYVLLITVGVYRDVKPGELPGVVRRTAVLVGAILMIMGAALGFTDWLTVERIPQMILAAMQQHIQGQLTFLLTLNVFLLIVGCLMDIFSAILVVVPLIVPVAHEFGVDPYHLAVVFLVNLEIGYSTPPVGINLFIASLRFRRPVFALYRASVLFIGVLLLALLLITYVPFFTLGLFKGLPGASLRAPLGVELEDDGLTLKQVFPEGWAARAGLRAGDTLLALGEQPLGKYDLRERLDGAEGKGSLRLRRDGQEQAVEVSFDERRVAGALTIKQHQAGSLHVEVDLGGVGLREAKARRKATLDALRAKEAELGFSYDERDEAVKAAEEALNTAPDAQARAAARARVAEAKRARAPLDALARDYEQARRLADDVATLARTVQWRARPSGAEASGPDLRLDQLPPGTHSITATAEDKRRHLVQAALTVTVLPGERPAAPPRKTTKKTGGDDGAWGDDDDDGSKKKTGGDDGAWGDDDDDGSKKKTGGDDGAWGDDDDDGSKRKTGGDDGSWGDDDDDGKQKTGK
ncbi:MAG: TRAP transporter large permease subunit [Planctomycetota bacterium]